MAIDDVRFYVGDTDEPYLLTDAQITLAINATTSDVAAAAMCARALAARFAQKVDTQFETISTSGSQRSRAYLRMATTLEQQAKKQGGLGTPEAGGISIAAMEAARTQTDRVKPTFRRGMFANPPTGTDDPISSGS